MNKLPIAKTDNLVIQNFENETLIYDLNANKAFCLNETSAIVYQACDGKTTFDELKNKTNFTDDLIHLTFSALQKQGFIEIPLDYVSPLAGMSRREAVKKVGLATVFALPIIASIVAPSATMAQSGGGNLALFAACTADLQCTTMFCNPTTNGNVCCNVDFMAPNTGRFSPNEHLDCSTNQGECNTLMNLCCSGSSLHTNIQGSCPGGLFECRCV